MLATPKTLYRARVAPDDNKRQGEEFDVIPSLMDVLSKAMKDKKREASELERALPKHKRTLSDYLERKRMPVGKNVEVLVAAVSVLTERDRFALWADAVRSARESARRLGEDPRLQDAEVALSAPPSESE